MTQATNFEQLGTLFWQGSYSAFFAQAEQESIPSILLETIALSIAPEFAERYRGGSLEGLLWPQTKRLLQVLSIVYQPVAERMREEALKLPVHHHHRLQLLAHSLDCFARAGEEDWVWLVLKQILEDWPPNAFINSLYDPQTGEEVARLWLFQVTQYLRDLSQEEADAFLLTASSFYHREAAAAYGRWVNQKQNGDSAWPEWYIPPEIRLDEPFGAALAEICRDPSLRVVVEVGASSGEGSTAVLRYALPNSVRIYSIEAHPERYKELARRVSKDPRCIPIHAAAQPRIATVEEVEEWLKSCSSFWASYSREQALEWHQEGQDLLKSVPTDGASRVPDPDLLLIDGGEFTGWYDLQVFLERGARPKYIALDDIFAFKNSRCLTELSSYGYRLICWGNVRNGFAIFKDSRATLPIHFFTIVLDGEPYIERHYSTLCELDKLGIPWQWVVVEGVAALRHDTGWSLANGGRIPEEYAQGHSLDGTVEYLRDLAAKDTRVRLVQKPDGQFWDGKIEMVRAAQPDYPCLLWQLDADEIWTAEQIRRVHRRFEADPSLEAAQFYCRYFVGPNLVLDNKGKGGNNPQMEWWRVWRWDPAECEWQTHEPPILTRNGQVPKKVLTADQAEAEGLVFDHYAYALRKQVEFKESYYGYQGAVRAWEELQKAEKPCSLQPFFPWAYGDPLVVEVRQRLHLFVDGVFFQMYQTGIATVWRNLLRELPQLGIRITFYDRGGMGELPQGVERMQGHPFSYARWDDPELRQAFIWSGADVFMSTYYTYLPPDVPQVLLLHDMIPEVLGWDLSDPMWRQKHAALEAAARIVAVSQNTACDLLRLTGKEAVVAYPGVDTSVFKPDPSAIPKHWLLIGCHQGTYKRQELFFEAYQQWSYKPFPVLCTHSWSTPEAYRQAAAPQPVMNAYLDLQQLVQAYQNAVALVYPSAYEGFGLPVLEAMACGTPVIIYPNSALVEVGGEAAFYVEDSLSDTLVQVLDPKLRAEKVRKGLEWVKSFTWERMAKTIQEVLHLAVKPSLTAL